MYAMNSLENSLHIKFMARRLYSKWLETGVEIIDFPRVNAPNGITVC